MTDDPGNRQREDAAGSPRRWYQFRLRTIFVGMVVLGCLLVAYRAYIEPYRQQRQAMNRIKELGGTYQATAAESWQRWLFGDDYQNLTFVNLANCDQVDEYLPHVLRLPHLQTLVVGGAAFGDEHVRQIDHIKTLESLVLDSTSVTRGPRERFRHGRSDRPGYAKIFVAFSDQRTFAALANLDVGATTRVRLNGMDELKRQLGENYFDGASGFATDARIDDKVVEHLNRLSSVNLLFVRNPQAGDADLLELAKLKRRDDLETLTLVLRGTQVTDGGLAHLSALTWLEDLNLAGTKITDRGLAHLADLPNLRHLDLTGTSITDAGAEHLKAMKQLKTVDLSETSVTATGIKAIAEALPECSVFAVGIHRH